MIFDSHLSTRRQREKQIGKEAERLGARVGGCVGKIQLQRIRCRATMASKLHAPEKPEATHPDDQNELAVSAPRAPLATASLSLALSAILPTNFILPKTSGIFAPPPTKVRIPSQVSSLSQLSLSSSSTLPPPALKSNSNVSANPLQNPLSNGPRRSPDPSNSAGIRRAAIVWFRNDLRVQDNECLNSANDESMSVLPVYCFDPKDYGKSSSGFDKTGPCRATFLIEAVSDLRRSLRAKGSDLVVRIGSPEQVLVELAKAVGADAVYAHREVSRAEAKAEEKIESLMKDEGVELKYFWGSTLYHMDDLPFKMEGMPSTYGGFRDKVQGLEIRKTVEALDQLKGLPSRGDVEPGEVPSLLDLGLKPSVTMSQDGKPAANSSVVGGETEAFRRLEIFSKECHTQLREGTNISPDCIYGANFSSKISPWLSVGCISPRSMFNVLKKTSSRFVGVLTHSNLAISSKVSPTRGDGSAPADAGMNWLLYELLWRDFFRFITKKYSSTEKQLDAAPVGACAGALA